jgi:hypothetical protein
MHPRALSATLVFCSVFARFLEAQIPPPAATLTLVPDPVKTLVDRLDLEQYKVNIKGLTSVWRPAPGNRAQPRGN